MLNPKRARGAEHGMNRRPAADVSGRGPSLVADQARRLLAVGEELAGPFVGRIYASPHPTHSNDSTRTR